MRNDVGVKRAILWAQKLQGPVPFSMYGFQNWPRHCHINYGWENWETQNYTGDVYWVSTFHKPEHKHMTTPNHKRPGNITVCIRKKEKWVQLTIWVSAIITEQQFTKKKLHAFWCETIKYGLSFFSKYLASWRRQQYSKIFQEIDFHNSTCIVAQ